MTKVIGICGPSGSGKTTLARSLSDELGAVIVSLDNYFLLDPPYKKYEAKEKNWELPENIDWDALKMTISTLRSGNKAQVRKMNWETNTFTLVAVMPSDLLIVEGFLLFYDLELLKYLDLAAYIDVSDEIGLERRMLREGTEENKKWFTEVTFPEYASQRKILKSRANLVLDGTNTIFENLHTLKQAITDLR